MLPSTARSPQNSSATHAHSEHAGVRSAALRLPLIYWLAGFRILQAGQNPFHGFLGECKLFAGNRRPSH